MNNTVEHDFFGFPKVKWLHLTGLLDLQAWRQRWCPQALAAHLATSDRWGGQICKISCEIFSGFNTHTHTHPFNGPLSGTTQVSQYQKGKTNLDFTGARESEWQWNPLGHMQVCISHQTGNHASTPLLSFLQAGCPSSAQPTVSKQTYQNH